MRAEVGVAAQLHLGGGDVIGPIAFGLQLVVIHYHVVAGDDFRYRIGQGMAAGRRALVFLDDGGLAIRFGYDEDAGMVHGWMAVGRGADSDLDGLLDNGALGDVDVEAVFEIGGVQCDEGIVAKAGVTREMLFDRRFGKPGDLDAGLIAGRNQDRRHGREAGAGNRRNTGESPLFVVGGGETQLAKPAAGFFADGFDHADSTISA